MYIEKLRNYQKEIFDLQHCINVIGWDLRISCPKDEKDEVIKLIGSLEDKLFKLQTSSEYENILKNAIDSDEFKALEDNEQLYVKALLKKFEKRVNIPSEFYVKYTEFVHKSTTVWEEAKKNNDYASFKPYLEYMIELTCMHIILRYEIERDLFSGKINVNDLPDIWNKKMKEYLGVEVTSDKDGILQDVHWAEGDFGYFPSYLIGSIYDGIFLEIIEKQLGSINEILSSGNIKVITKFLIDNVYVNGGAYTGRAVLKALGVDEISVGPVVNYFYGKYGNNHGLRK